MSDGRPTLTPDLEQIPKRYEDACFVLAKSHAEEHGFAVRVMCFPDPSKKEVRLVEISDSFPVNQYGAVMCPGPNGGPGQAKLTIPVVALRPSPDFPFRSSVALVTEAEWDRVAAGELAVAGNWDLQNSYQIWPQ